MADRQFAEPMIIRGLTQDSLGEPARLRRIRLRADMDRRYPQFDEKWFRDLLFKYPSLLPSSEIEPAFRELEPIARELPVAGMSADLLFVNSEGYIAIVETKLLRNPGSRREVVAQVIDYACQMSEWSYAQLVEAVRMATKSSDSDPLLTIMRKAAQDGPFDENEFVESVSRNLRKGRFLLLIIGDDASAEAERMVDFIQRTPHLHFTIGLVELALFHEKEGSVDPLFVQPRIVAKTTLHHRVVIDIALADGVNMKSQIRQQSSPRSTGSTISAEAFFEQLRSVSPVASELAGWALEHAPEHQLTADWGASGPSIKYSSESIGTSFNFGQIGKDGSLRTGSLLPKFVKLGLPMDIAVGYLDEIIRLVPDAYRKEFGWQHEIRTQVVLYGKNDSWLPLEKLAPYRQQWFEAIDRAIQKINDIQGQT